MFCEAYEISCSGSAEFIREEEEEEDQDEVVPEEEETSQEVQSKKKRGRKAQSRKRVEGELAVLKDIVH